MLDSNSYTDIQTCEILEEEESKEDFLNLKDYEKEIKESESKDEESPSERNKNLTQKIYGLLKKHEYNQVINILNKQLSSDDNSRAVHSVLGYAYFQIANYKQAAEMYEYLNNGFPEVVEYKLYHAHCLFKIGKFEAALRVADAIEKTELKPKVMQLKAAIFYARNNLIDAKQMLDEMGSSDVEKLINEGCIAFKELQFDAALQKYEEALRISSYFPELYYNTALCLFKINKYEESLKYLQIIIKKSQKLLQENEVLVEESSEDEIRNRKEKVSCLLRKTCLIEGMNLKASIEYLEGKFEKSKKTIKELSDFLGANSMQCDPVTYHNEAIIFVNENATESIKRLNELISCSVFPSESFHNLINLYSKYRFFDLANELLNENPVLASKHLQKDEYDYVKALIMEQTNTQEALKQYDKIIHNYKKNIDLINAKLTHSEHSPDVLSFEVSTAPPLPSHEIQRLTMQKKYLSERLVCILSNKAKIYWDNKNFPLAEEVFLNEKNYCKGIDSFNLNLGHTLFMQEHKYDEAIYFYEQIVNKNKDNLNQVETFVLANLCVCYILTNQNEKAEELMTRIKKHEEISIMQNPSAPGFHFCSVNLVIGTLYCSKENFEFGLDLIIKNLYPIEEKLGTDTWHYVKRCLLALIEQLSKKMLTIKDNQFFKRVIAFLDDVQIHGKNITTVFYPNSEGEKDKSTVAYEASYFKKILQKLYSKYHK